MERFVSVLEYAETNLIYIGLLGAIGFPVYFVVWEYLLPQSYENLWFRLSCSFLYIPWLFYQKYFYRMKAFFSIYFLFSMFYSLPFFFSFMFIQSEFSQIWAMSLISAFSILIIVVHDWVLISLMVVFGLVFAYLIAVFIGTPVIWSNFQVEFLPIYLFVLIACTLASHRNKLDRQLKAKNTISLAGSIAHEMRNPLSQINGTLHFVSSQISALDKQLVTYLNDANLVVKSGLQVIDITMDAINEKPVNEDDFQLISAENICFEAVNDFAYKDEEHAAKVSLKGDDFDFLVDPVLVKYVLYNLIGNALHYVKTLPQSEIVISLFPESRQIHIRDTGPGIEASFIPKIFESFSTSGKQGGTGLGLAYCKRTMLAFGGDIHCESELGEYSNFILSFPEVWPKKAKRVFALGSF